MPFCSGCGSELGSDARFCAVCGQATVPAGGGIGQDPAMRLLLPVGRSGWAIAAGYLGLFSVLLVPAPLALICGILAIRSIRRDAKLHGMGRAIFGIVMGVLGTLLLLMAIVAGLTQR